MEAKTTQRILGVCVVIALVVIALPLFFNKNEAVTDTVASKSPDQTTQTVALNDNTNNASSTDSTDQSTNSTDNSATTTTTVPTQDSTSSTTTTGLSSTTTQTDPNNNATTTTTVTTTTAPTTQQTQPTPSTDTTPAIATPPTVQTPTDPASQTNQNTQANPASNSNTTPDTSATPNQDQTSNTSNVQTQKVSDASTTTSHHAKRLAKAGKSKVFAKASSHGKAWVVQMGYFKNKDNARKLTDQLRAAGFRAFSSTVRSGDKVRVRVFIGPEKQQSTAVAVAQQVTKQTNLQGVIVTYNPLSL